MEYISVSKKYPKPNYRHPSCYQTGNAWVAGPPRKRPRKAALIKNPQEVGVQTVPEEEMAHKRVIMKLSGESEHNVIRSGIKSNHSFFRGNKTSEWNNSNKEGSQIFKELLMDGNQNFMAAQCIVLPNSTLASSYENKEPPETSQGITSTFQSKNKFMENHSVKSKQGSKDKVIESSSLESTESMDTLVPNDSFESRDSRSEFSDSFSMETIQDFDFGLSGSKSRFSIKTNPQQTLFFSMKEVPAVELGKKAVSLGCSRVSSLASTKSNQCKESNPKEEIEALSFSTKEVPDAELGKKAVSLGCSRVSTLSSTKFNRCKESNPKEEIEAILKVEDLNEHDFFESKPNSKNKLGGNLSFLTTQESNISTSELGSLISMKSNAQQTSSFLMREEPDDEQRENVSLTSPENGSRLTSHSSSISKVFRGSNQNVGKETIKEVKDLNANCSSERKPNPRNNRIGNRSFLSKQESIGIMSEGKSYVSLKSNVPQTSSFLTNEHDNKQRENEGFGGPINRSRLSSHSSSISKGLKGSKQKVEKESSTIEKCSFERKPNSKNSLIGHRSFVSKQDSIDVKSEAESYVSLKSNAQQTSSFLMNEEHDQKQTESDGFASPANRSRMSANSSLLPEGLRGTNPKVMIEIMKSLDFPVENMGFPEKASKSKSMAENSNEMNEKSFTSVKCQVSEEDFLWLPKCKSTSLADWNLVDEKDEYWLSISRNSITPFSMSSLETVSKAKQKKVTHYL